MKKIQRGAVSEVQASLELEKMKTVEWLLANIHQLCDSPRRKLALPAGRSLAALHEVTSTAAAAYQVAQPHCSITMVSGMLEALPVWRNGRRTGLKILGP
jgi:hypothetical protein